MPGGIIWNNGHGGPSFNTIPAPCNRNASHPNSLIDPDGTNTGAEIPFPIDTRGVFIPPPAPYNSNPAIRYNHSARGALHPGFYPTPPTPPSFRRAAAACGAEPGRSEESRGEPGRAEESRPLRSAPGDFYFDCGAGRPGGGSSGRRRAMGAGRSPRFRPFLRLQGRPRLAVGSGSCSRDVRWGLRDGAALGDPEPAEHGRGCGRRCDCPALPLFTAVGPSAVGAGQSCAPSCAPLFPTPILPCPRLTPFALLIPFYPHLIPISSPFYPYYTPSLSPYSYSTISLYHPYSCLCPCPTVVLTPCPPCPHLSSISVLILQYPHLIPLPSPFHPVPISSPLLSPSLSHPYPGPVSPCPIPFPPCPIPSPAHSFSI